MEQQVKSPEDPVMDMLLREQRRRFARSTEDDMTQTNEPRTAPPYLNNNIYHWLISEPSSFPSVAEWINGNWYCVNEIGPVTPEEMHRRGWRWYERIWIHDNTKDKSFDEALQLKARPSWDDTWMQVVDAMAKRSTCARRAVGCVIVSADNVLLSTGYNGVQSGAPHCSEGYHCPAAYASSGLDLDRCYAVHSEQNALWRCKQPELMHTIYVSSSPCTSCIKLLLNTPIVRVVFHERYVEDEQAERLWVMRNHHSDCVRVWELYQ